MHNRPSLTIVLTQHDALFARAGKSQRQLRQTLGNRCLLQALAAATSSDPAQWTLAKDASNRPLGVRTTGDSIENCLSLSHSGPFVVAAASWHTCLGIDLEVKKDRNFAGIGKFLDWPGRIGANTAIGADAFYFLWTLWEATIKATSGMDGHNQHEIFGQLARRSLGTAEDSAAEDGWAVQSWSNSMAGLPDFQLTIAANSTVRLQPRLLWMQADNGMLSTLNTDDLRLHCAHGDLPTDTSQ